MDWPLYRAAFAARRPLPETWRSLSADARGRAVAYWIRWARTDGWTFDQLGELAASILESGETLPPPLKEHTVARLKGETVKRRRTGPHGDAARDVLIAAMVETMVEHYGVSQREACRIIGRTFAFKSPEAIESARRRGSRV